MTSSVFSSNLPSCVTTSTAAHLYMGDSAITAVCREFCHFTIYILIHIFSIRLKEGKHLHARRMTPLKTAVVAAKRVRRKTSIVQIAIYNTQLGYCGTLYEWYRDVTLFILVCWWKRWWWLWWWSWDDTQHVQVWGVWAEQPHKQPNKLIAGTQFNTLKLCLKILSNVNVY